MKIGVVTIAYNLPEATWNLMQSVLEGRNALRSNEVKVHLFLHSAHWEVGRVCRRLAQDSRVHYYPYGENRGLAKSWNEGIWNAYMQDECDVVVVANDDIIFGEGDLDTLAEFAVEHADKYVIPAWGWQERVQKRGSIGFSAFAINPVAVQHIGAFDQNFFPIYFEDCDYNRRAHLLGLELLDCQETNLVHGGSMAINTDHRLLAQHNQTFPLNQAYYVRKWGGGPGQEVYEYPFNDVVPLRIDWAQRDNPYGAYGYDRTDQDVVRL